MALAGVSAVIALLTALPAGARIVGADERAPVPAEMEAQFSGVGRLVCRNPASGSRFSTTATLVGNRSTLLAAGHFGNAQDAGREVTISPDYCAFELRSGNGQRFFASPLAPRPVTRFSRRAKPDPSTPDWAIIKLEIPAPASVSPVKVLPMSVKNVSERSGAFMISYHSSPEDLARTKRYSPGCRLSPAIKADLIFRHTCDTEAGSSGGLLYIMTAGGPRAVGINHGSATDRGWNYAQVITSEIASHLPQEGIDGSYGF